MNDKRGILLRSVACGALSLLGCACGSTGVREDASRRAGPVEPFRLVEVELPGLDIEQIGAGPDVDYIIESIGTGAAWLDYDGDGDADLYLVQGSTPDRPRHGPPDRLLRNDGDDDGDGLPSFTDRTEGSGLGDRSWSFGAAVADYDADGDPDLYLTNWGANRLYRNNGDGTFTDVATAAGVDHPGWGISAAWSDVDRDGDLDLFVANYVEFELDRYPARGEPGARGAPPCRWRGVEVYCGPRNLVAESDVLFVNDGDTDGDDIPNFRDATVAAGLSTAPYFAISAHFFDADNDGDDDLYVANDSVQNCYFVNRGDGTFEETSILSGLAYNEQGHEQAGMGITVGDYNRDGLLDLAVTNFSHDHDTLYRNDGPLRFTDVSYPAGIGSPSYLTLGWGIGFLDLDQDGWEDLFVAHGHVYPQVDGLGVGTSFRQTNALFRNVGDGTFEDLGQRGGPGLADVAAHRALLPIDLDGDGDQDLLITRLNDRPLFLQNQGAPGHWLEVRLKGVGGNRDGLGAKVRLTVDGATQQREIRRDTGFAGSTLPVAHFGLGAAERVDRLDVVWPSGRRSVLEDLPADRRIEVEEPATGKRVHIRKRPSGWNAPRTTSIRTGEAGPATGKGHGTPG